MGDVVYTARVRIEQQPGRIRRVQLPVEAEPVLFGVHGAVAEHYGITPTEEHATTVDYLVASAAG